MNLNWESEANLPGIQLAEYKGYKLKIKPLGTFEFLPFINGKVVEQASGYDDFDLVAALMCEIIDVAQTENIAISAVRLPKPLITITQIPR